MNDLFTDYEEKGDKVVDLKGFEVFLKSIGRGRIGFHQQLNLTGNDEEHHIHWMDKI